MSDVNIDALSGAELKEQAKVLGISLIGNPKDDTLRDKIREALGEVPAAETVAAAPVVDETERMITIIIARSERDKQPVPIGVNGRVIRIKRGEQVTIPERFVHALRNAVQQIRDADSGEMRDVEAYPFQILG